MKSATTGTIPEITTDGFAAEVLQAPGTVLVKFWAEWCPPCRMLVPILEQLAAEQHAGLRIVSVNSDDHPEIAARYRVLALPTMLVFQDGTVVSAIVGAKPASVLREKLAAFLG